MKHVYGISRPDGAIKVGISGNLEVRNTLLSKQIGQPTSVMFLIPKRGDARTVEMVAHQLMREKRDNGEWFFVSVEEAMKSVSQAVDIVEGRAFDSTGVLLELEKKRIASIGKMRVVNYRLPEPLLDEIEKLSERWGIRQSELIRRAVREFLDRNSVPQVPE